MLVFTGLTGEPPSPSPSGGHLSLSLAPRILVFRSTCRLSGRDALRLRSPYRVRLSARTGRHS